MADADFIPPVINNGGTGSVNVGGVRAPDYRQIQSPAEVNVRGIDRAASAAGDAAAGRARELGDAFKQFEGDANAIGDKLAVQKGQAAGAAAGAAGTGAPISGLASITPYAGAYNAAVHSTYITNSQLSLEQHLSDIEGQNVGNPDGFQTQSTAVVQAALKQMDPTYVPEMSLWAQSRIQAGLNRQNDQKATDVRNQALATYQSATPDLTTAAIHTAIALPGPQGDAVISKLYQDDRDKLNALVASRVITPEQANTLHQKFLADADNQFTGARIDKSLQPILQTMRSNVEAADKLIVTPDPNLAPAENATRVQEFEKEREQYVKSQSQAHVDDLAGVHQQLAGGSYGADVEGQLHGLYKQGALTEEGLFSGLAESLRNQKADAEDQASMKLVDDVVHGVRQGPLDPKDSTQAAAVDKYFQEHIALSGQGIGDQQYAAGAAEVFRQTGILPASVQSRIRIGLLSGDPVRAASAAGLAAKIQGVNPTADSFVSNPRLAAISGLINDNVKAGLPVTQAYTMALRAVDIPEGERKVRDQNYGAAVKSTNNTNSAALQQQLDKATPGMFAHSPPAPIPMQAEFDSLTRQYYDQTGNIGKARDLAGADVQKTWGVSTVNGSPELQKYPVSDAQVPTVRADIATSAKAAGYDGDPLQLHLTPNANTDASGGRIWSLTHVAPDGAQDILLGPNNRPLQYSMPSTQNFAQARQALIDQKLDRARQQRDFDRQTSLDQIPGEKQLADHYLRTNASAIPNKE